MKTSGIQFEQNERGFDMASFKDRLGLECSLQKSSAADEDCIWFGCDKNAEAHMGHTPSPRMHLTREMVAHLLPALQRFVETGSLSPLDDDDDFVPTRERLQIEASRAAYLAFTALDEPPEGLPMGLDREHWEMAAAVALAALTKCEPAR